MKDLLTIKEFAEFSDVEQTTLRYWDEIGLFSPAKRGEENNYRYYKTNQIISVNFIKVLSSMSFPLKTIGAAKNNRNPENILNLIEKQENQLNMELRSIQEKYSMIHMRKKLIKEGLQYMDSPGVRITREDRERYVLGPVNEYSDEGEKFYKAFVNFCDKADEYRINLKYPIGGFHKSMDAFSKAPGKPEKFFSLDPSGNQERDGGDYLTCIGRGYYGALDGIYGAMNAYAEEHGLKLTGPVYSVYLHDEICLNDSDEYLVKVIVKIL